MPGVRAAALVQPCLEQDLAGDDDITIAEHPPPNPGDAPTRRACVEGGPWLFLPIEITLLNGRFFTSDDHFDRARKVIISQPICQAIFPRGKSDWQAFTYSMKTALLTRLWHGRRYALAGRSTDPANHVLSHPGRRLWSRSVACNSHCFRSVGDVRSGKSRLQRSIRNCPSPTCRPCNRRLEIRWAMLASVPPWCWASRCFAGAGFGWPVWRSPS